MRPYILAALPLFILGGCAVGPDYHPPAAIASAAKWVEPASANAVDARWWQRLGDPVLTGLVDMAVSRNPDIRIADAQLLEARANRAAAAGRRLPQIGVTGSVTDNQLSANGPFPLAKVPGFDRRYSLYDAGFDASWEIDLWGRATRDVQAASARAQAAVEARRGVLLQTIAEVVRAYVDLRGAQARLASAMQDADARGQIAALVGQRFRGGEASRFDAARADAQADATRALVPGLQASVRAAAYQLALLTGQPPEAMTALADHAASLPSTPPTVGVGLRSDLLRRRPDVRRAERDLAAATADVGVATADLFPRITLTGALGQQSRTAGDFTSGGSTRFQIGPSLSWPIFNFGRIHAQIRAADARSQAAAVRYEKSVLGALADSETALNRYAAAGAERRAREAARAQSATALDLARQLHRAGEDDLLVLLDAQSAYSESEQAALIARAAELSALAALYKALGGGWESFPDENRSK
jgi:NodT family efflux transporter outer membrane factor (OMF) lipoprotein